MDWKSINLPQGSRMFRSHSFTFMSKSASYQLFVDEYSDGSYTGHAEHSTDKNLVIESVTGTSLNDCLEALVKKIEMRK